ncbi:hypothetical protein V6N00_04740 [Tersicoccus sp. MR15.9]|uniref:hypothetical protein n=1 Tax=Tersicoccus mangrovi TaxID=3121635 RepID=UPI002FE5AC7E
MAPLEGHDEDSADQFASEQIIELAPPRTRETLPPFKMEVSELVSLVVPMAQTAAIKIELVLFNGSFNSYDDPRVIEMIPNPREIRDLKFHFEYPDGSSLTFHPIRRFLAGYLLYDGEVPVGWGSPERDQSLSNRFGGRLSKELDRTFKKARHRVRIATHWTGQVVVGTCTALVILFMAGSLIVGIGLLAILPLSGLISLPSTSPTATTTSAPITGPTTAAMLSLTYGLAVLVIGAWNTSVLADVVIRDRPVTRFTRFLGATLFKRDPDRASAGIPKWRTTLSDIGIKLGIAITGGLTVAVLVTIFNLRK